MNFEYTFIKLFSAGFVIENMCYNYLNLLRKF